LQLKNVGPKKTHLANASLRELPKILRVHTQNDHKKRKLSFKNYFQFESTFHLSFVLKVIKGNLSIETKGYSLEVVAHIHRI
jgi:type IV secretory pathway ATPase VirB11/archaellum biosynthesis ATPase